MSNEIEMFTAAQTYDFVLSSKNETTDYIRYLNEKIKEAAAKGLMSYEEEWPDNVNISVVDIHFRRRGFRIEYPRYYDKERVKAYRHAGYGHEIYW